VETLFGVAIRADTAPVWHDSVRFYRVWRGSAPVAAFYLDLHARSGKQSGAWMDEARARWRRPEGGLQLPVAHLVCNFAPPVGDQPALLTHDDVITLFHEFGHGLHHMLTQVDELAVSGIAGVEGDAVELPSQFMENFCWEWEVLQRLSAHVQTRRAAAAGPCSTACGRPVTSAAAWACCGTASTRCLTCVCTASPAAAHVQALADAVCAEIQPVPAPDFRRYAHSFTHLFDGGYAAGYYGYAWAEVLSADAYSAFEEAGVFDPATGQRFRETILEVGGSRPAMTSFQAFRGREPRLDALAAAPGPGLDPGQISTCEAPSVCRTRPSAN
jgi:oligopeptidase A